MIFPESGHTCACINFIFSGFRWNTINWQLYGISTINFQFIGVCLFVCALILRLSCSLFYFFATEYETRSTIKYLFVYVLVHLRHSISLYRREVYEKKCFVYYNTFANIIKWISIYCLIVTYKNASRFELLNIWSKDDTWKDYFSISNNCFAAELMIKHKIDCILKPL